MGGRIVSRERSVFNVPCGALAHAAGCRQGGAQIVSHTNLSSMSEGPFAQTQRELGRTQESTIPGARDAPITTALIVINVLVFALEEMWGGSETTRTLVGMGAIFSDGPAGLRWATLLSYGYLHIGPLHIGMNMFGLWNIGRMLEPLLGPSRFFVLYTLSLLGGGLAIALSPTPHITAGASGALFGLLGAVCALLLRRYRNSRSAPERKVLRGFIGRMLLPNVLISLLPGVSFLGHAGGLVIGALFMARSLVGPADPRAALSSPKGAAPLDAFAVLLALFTLGAVAWQWWSFAPWAAYKLAS